MLNNGKITVHGKNSLMRKPVFNTMGHVLGLIEFQQEKKAKIETPKKPSVAGSGAMTAGATSRVTSDPHESVGFRHIYLWFLRDFFGLVANRLFQRFQIPLAPLQTKPGAASLKGMGSAGIIAGGLATAKKAKAKPKTPPPQPEVLTVPASSLPEA